ncbi:DUF6328 family protein [Actinomadura flavalba]|uniref:DUF6328 family protein n=1 Tax=Actinomadura flavalba TaxID=1120938 RepID=UPI000368CA4E|nr:DUF6328 family protein [Actinomadura flavalba]
MTTTASPKDETDAERVDRQLVELLQGIRVAVTGVQVLFAFLLTVPFASRWEEVDGGGEVLYYVALYASALASVCFIAPVIQHRVLFMAGQKKRLVRRANQFGIWGALALAVAVISSTTLIIETLLTNLAATLTAVALLVLCGWFWFLQPYLHRHRHSTPLDDNEGDDADDHDGERRGARASHAA